MEFPKVRALIEREGRFVVIEHGHVSSFEYYSRLVTLMIKHFSAPAPNAMHADCDDG